MARSGHAYPYGDIMVYRNSHALQGNQPEKGAKVKSINSGIASNAAVALRSGINAIIPNIAGDSLQRRFARSLMKWLRENDVEKLTPCENIPCISDLRFTTGPSFAERFKVPVSISRTRDKLTVTISAFTPTTNVSAPENTMLIEVVFAVSGCFLSSAISTGAQVLRLEVPYNNSEVASQSLHFKLPTEKGVLTVTGAWLQYYMRTGNGIRRVDDADFLPASLLNARYW